MKIGSYYHKIRANYKAATGKFPKKEHPKDLEIFRALVSVHGKSSSSQPDFRHFGELFKIVNDLQNLIDAA